MAEFRVTVEAVWQKDGSFEDFGTGKSVSKKSDGEDSEEEAEDDGKGEEKMDDSTDGDE